MALSFAEIGVLGTQRPKSVMGRSSSVARAKRSWQNLGTTPTPHRAQATAVPAPPSLRARPCLSHAVSAPAAVSPFGAHPRRCVCALLTHQALPRCAHAVLSPAHSHWRTRAFLYKWTRLTLSPRAALPSHISVAFFAVAHMPLLPPRAHAALVCGAHQKIPLWVVALDVYVSQGSPQRITATPTL